MTGASRVPAMKKTGPAASAATTIPASSRGPSTSRCRLFGAGASAIPAFHLRDRLRHRLAFLFALLDPRGRDDMLVLGHVEQADARAVAADHTGVADAHPDQLRLVGDQHQLLTMMSGEGSDDRAVAGEIVDIGDPLAAAVGPPVLIGRGALAIAVAADGEDELLRRLELRHPLRRQGRLAFAFLPGRR